jgi:hypothetical protein
VKWLVDQASRIVSGQYGRQLTGRGSKEVTARSITTGAHRSRSGVPTRVVVTKPAGHSIATGRMGSPSGADAGGGVA